jgi:TRAP-type C4-dicarboxylate transport system permease small subunit
MAELRSVLTDNSKLSRLDQALFQLEKFLALISGIAVFMLMCLAVISVTGRNFFNQPLPGYVDWIEQAMPLIAFMGISYTQRLGGHIRMDLLVGLLKGRGAWIAELFTTLAILIVMMIMVYGTFSHFLRSFDLAGPLWSRDSSMDIGLPLWPAKLLVPIAFSVLMLRLLLQCQAYARAIINDETRPVAVPMIDDAATQAAREAALVSDLETEGHNR